MFYWLFVVLILLLALPLLWTWLSGGPYTPIPYTMLEQILEQIQPQPDDIFIDLGAGDGRVLKMVHDKFKIRTRGYEIHPLVWFSAYLRIRSSKPKGLSKIFLKNMFNADLSKADYVFLHLLPHGLARLQNKLLAELPSQAKVISYGVQLNKLRCTQTIQLEKKSPLDRIFTDIAYIYELPK